MNAAPTTAETQMLYTLRDAARRLAISDRYLDALIRRRNLPVVRFGRAVRVPHDVLERLASEGAPRLMGSPCTP